MSEIKNLILGNKALQKLWWHLYKISLKGMNYDRGHIPSANGEAFAIKYAQKSLKENKSFTLFDVGANRGQYLKMLFEELHPLTDFKIFCFEPQKDAFKSLLRVSEKNKNVVTENIGLGNHTHEATLYKDSPQSEFASLYPANYRQYNTELTVSEEIEITTLDEYCDGHGIHSIDYLKLDVEGHEIEVLKGASRLLSSGNIAFIQFEFGLSSIESRIFLKDFFNLLPQYEIYRILPHGLELINYTEYYELFLTTNYMAIKKN